MSYIELTDPYYVRKGDTLGAIAKRSGKSLQDLMRWNGIKNANQLQVGTSLNLSEESAFGVSILFLDALRSPIETCATKSSTTARPCQASRPIPVFCPDWLPAMQSRRSKSGFKTCKAIGKTYASRLPVSATS